MLPSESLVRLRPLFAVGIHDIPLLEELSKPPAPSQTLAEDEDVETSSTQSNTQPLGWLACTTDEILVMKPTLYDLVVEMPSTHLDQPAANSAQRKRPLIKLAGSQQEIKATQRDWRRYKLLRRALHPLRKALVPQGNGAIHEDEEEEDDQDGDSNSDTAPLLRSLTNIKEADEDGDDEDERDSVEPTTWSELAYQGFMWWASAGEQDESSRDEEAKDNDLLGDLADVARRKADKVRYQDEDEVDSEDESNQLLGDNSPLEDKGKGRVDASVEMEIISHFHRITKSIFEVAQEHVSDDGNEDDEDYDTKIPRFDTEALRSMGLDAWSNSDRAFVANFVELWFERDVRVDSGSVEWCGVRIC
jgi:hypothetical protein